MNVATESQGQQKAAIRKTILDQRQSQDPAIRAERSRVIVRALLKTEEFQRARAVLIYLSKDEEVATDELMAEAFAVGKRVLVPVVDPVSDELQIAELSGPEPKFQSGAFGVREPAPEELNIVSPDGIDLVVAPGVGFDRRGGRIGYGKGYYDRLLRQLATTVPRVALAFDFQVLDAVPQNEDDIRMHTLITEKTTMDCSGV